MQVKRITRLLRLLQALQCGDGGNADRLAKTCGMSRRTVFRDIESLRRAGVPVVFDRQRDRYSIDGEHFLPPTNFTAEEALTVICLSEQAGRPDGLPFFEPALRAARKLEASLPSDVRDQVRSITGSIHVRGHGVNPMEGKDGVYRRLVDAQARRRAVRVAYENRNGREKLTTDLSPYELVFSMHSWYVVGRSSFHREVRTFNLARIAAIRPLPKSFRRPNNFSLRGYLRNAWNMVPEPGPDVPVHIRFDSQVAESVSEVLWHRTQRCETRDDGALDFYATVSGVGEISRWVLGYGDQAEVIAPAKLRRLVARRVANMALIYQHQA